MDFFKSVFSDEPDTPKHELESTSESSQTQNQPGTKPPTDYSTVWSFGGLVKTFSSKSEFILETYRRDLKEFSSGLKKEIEVAQGSLENVGHKIDELGASVLKGTAQIISHGKESILAADLESDKERNAFNPLSSERSLDAKRYSRFEAQVRALQGDMRTYCEAAEDVEEYEKWKSGFVLEEKEEERERLIEENEDMESVYKRVVPSSVNEETFWYRYYYKVYKLRQGEELRANLVKRAISVDDDEDLSWDVDEDDVAKEQEEKLEKVGKGNKELHGEDSVNFSKDEEAKRNAGLEGDSKENKEMGGKALEKIMEDEKSDEDKREEGDRVRVDLEKGEDEGVLKSDQKAGVELKSENGESSKESEFSVVSSHQSMGEEEDLGWDEIEDLSCLDEKRASHSSGSPNKLELQKRLSAPEEEEDLSWDVEDDDDAPVKA